MNSEWMIEADFDRAGAHHMERDEALARERLDNPALSSVLRLYSWQPAAVSIGYQQRMETIDLEASRINGVDVIRRPTGGRAVLHKNEITYAVVTKAEPADGLYAVHNRIVTALVKSLSSLQSVAQTSAALLVTPRSEPGQKNVLPLACFASAARHEVTWRGNKVIGSAQRRFGNVVLQHGSILLTGDHLQLPELLALPQDARREMRSVLVKKTATLADVFGRTISIQECAAAIRENFVTNFSSNIEFLAARETTNSSFNIHL